MAWYKFTPVDTLFFKGAQPMNLGENHTASHIFPPPARTISGALRTAVLVQNGISFEEYGSGNAPENIYDVIGEPDKNAPFTLTGPLFMVKRQVYVPAPYSWFMKKDCETEKINVVRGKLIKSPLLKSGSGKFFWAKGKDGNLVSLGGMWIKNQDLNEAPEIMKVKKIQDFFENEPRTGIALDKGRKVREGHLYSFNHARLHKNVSMIFGTDSDLPLAEHGVLKIGAEQRFGWYRKKSDNLLEFNDTGKGKGKGKGKFYASLSILKGNPETNQSVVATGKILYLGGWDLNRGFHKPMTGFFPAGTVFNKKINNNCIPVKEA